MKKTLENVHSNFQTIRTGRANPDLLSRIQVSCYGSMVPLQQVASVSVPEPMMFVLNVFDPQAVREVEKAIMNSDLGLNPQTEGAIIRLRLPDLTEERRKELVKLVGKFSEEGKISLRNIRRDILENLKTQEKNKDISEDDLTREQQSVQKLIDEFTAQIDKNTQEKEAEILQI
ncbi:MAG: ribosome recycling factor [Candidatus Margulisbacteria bacterium]|nr:ribosome recycling factor [Candidatus Margulisiibacteriota bacterium]